jgi:hypothetical protein
MAMIYNPHFGWREVVEEHIKAPLDYEANAKAIIKHYQDNDDIVHHFYENSYKIIKRLYEIINLIIKTDASKDRYRDASLSAIKEIHIKMDQICERLSEDECKEFKNSEHMASILDGMLFIMKYFKN